VRVIAFFVIDGLYLGSLKEAPPLTVVHHEKQVLDADRAARERGVRVGMPLSEAKVILAKEGHSLAWEEELYREAQERWVEMATEITDALEPVGQHAAFLDLSGHPRPSEVAAKLAERLRTELRYTVRYGLAASRWVAQESAKRGDESAAALHIPKRFVASLSTASLPLPQAIVGRLTLLGYRTVGAVAGLSLETLRAQFGELALEIQRLGVGGGCADVRAVFPKNTLSDRFCFDGPPDTVEVLKAGLRTVAARLGTTLRADDASAKAVELFLEGDDGTTEVRKRTFSKPITGAAVLFATVRLMLTDLPDVPLAAIRIRLTEVHRATRVQLMLDGGPSNRDKAASIEAALTSARTVFGDRAVQRGSDLVEPRYRKLRRAYTEVNGWRWG